MGFPGETEEDFEKLMEFVEEANFDKLGAFKYSKKKAHQQQNFQNKYITKPNKKIRCNNDISTKKYQNKNYKKK